MHGIVVLTRGAACGRSGCGLSRYFATKRVALPLHEAKSCYPWVFVSPAIHMTRSLLFTQLTTSTPLSPSRLDGALAAVAQGALGDSWLVSALNMLGPFPEFLKKIIVSDRHSDKGTLAGLKKEAILCV